MSLCVCVCLSVYLFVCLCVYVLSLTIDLFTLQCQYKPAVASLVAEVYDQINTQEILAYCGTKQDLSNGASDKQRSAFGTERMVVTILYDHSFSQMEKARKILIDCLMAEVHLENLYVCMYYGFSRPA